MADVTVTISDAKIAIIEKAHGGTIEDHVTSAINSIARAARAQVKAKRQRKLEWLKANRPAKYTAIKQELDKVTDEDMNPAEEEVVPE